VRPRAAAVLFLTLPRARLHWEGAAAAFADEARVRGLVAEALRRAWGGEPPAKRPRPAPPPPCAPACACHPAPPFSLASARRRRPAPPPPPPGAPPAAAAAALAEQWAAWRSPVWRAAAPGPAAAAEPPRSLHAGALRGCVALGAAAASVLLAMAADGTLIAVDQHAADERVLLEQLWRAHEAAAAREAEAGVGVGMEVRAALSPAQAAALRAHAARVRAAGWRWRDVAAGCELELGCPPAPAGGESLQPAHLLEWLTALADAGAAAHPHAPVLERLIASKACRSAIMFGDRLSKEEGALLLAALAQCRAPMACAHGRPTAAALAAVPAVEAASTPARARCRPSLARAEQRLVAALQ